ncbi:MAG: asparaginase [Actinomycetes bacterium]
MSGATELVTCTRRDLRSGRSLVESVHAGHLVVLAPDGTRHALGDPEHPTFVRSAAKPFQAAACLALLAEVEPATVAVLTDEEVAVAWASHRGEDRHLDAVRRLLARAGVDPAELTTPPATAEARPGEPPSRLQYNCSGKHALFALTGRALGLAGPALLDPDEALQSAVLDHLTARLAPAPAVAVDGCGAPAVAVPLVALARGFAGLWDDPDAERVVAAGLAHPGLVGGEGRLDSALLAAGVLAKVGAEGVYGASWRDGDGAAWGVALKVADGAVRAADAALRDLLVGAGVVPADTWVAPPVLGGGEAQGDVAAGAELAGLADRLARFVGV